MCGESVWEVYPSCEGTYPQLYKELEYPESDDKMRERLYKAMRHIVGDGHGAAGLNFGSVLVIGHASGIDALCDSLVGDVDTPPFPFCGLTSMQKASDGSWSMTSGLEQNFLSQGHTLSDVKPSFVPLPGTKATSGLAGMDKDGDGTLTRGEWMSEFHEDAHPDHDEHHA